LKNKIIFDLILNEQNNSFEQEFSFDSLLYLFNLNFENNNQILIDLYDIDGKLTGAQIRIDIQMRWFEFSEPIKELKEIKERIIDHFDYSNDDLNIYLAQIEALLEPFNPKNSQIEFSYHANLPVHIFQNDNRRKYKNIFIDSVKQSNIINDCLLYSGAKSKLSFKKLIAFKKKNIQKNNFFFQIKFYQK